MLEIGNTAAASGRNIGTIGCGLWEANASMSGERSTDGIGVIR